MKYIKLKEKVENIKQLRYSAKISQKDIAKHSVTTVQTISKWESENYQKVPINQLVNIMKYIYSINKNPDVINCFNDIIRICQNIKRIRENNGITQYELGIVCGVTPQTIWRWENDNYQFITFDNFLSIVSFMETKCQGVKNNHTDT